MCHLESFVVKCKLKVINIFFIIYDLYKINSEGEYGTIIGQEANNEMC